MTGVRRWQLSTLDGSDTYTLQINPNEMESPFPARAVTWVYNGPALGWSGKRAGNTPKNWSFRGVLRSQQQYEDMLTWIGRSEKIQLTDDRGDQWLIRLLTFKPTQQGSSRAGIVPWRMTYTVEAQVYAALGQMFDTERVAVNEKAAITPKGAEGAMNVVETATVVQRYGDGDSTTGVAEGESVVGP